MKNNVEWTKFINEMTPDLMVAHKKKTQFLAYENGRYFNAWIEFDQFEGGYFWCDEDDSEPTPSHYAPLPNPPKDAE